VKLSDWRGLAALAALVLAGGCAVGPDYHRPTTAVPENFRFAPDVQAGAGAASFADQGWWSVYRDATLQGLLREALAENFDVRIAAARVAQARAALGSARLQQLPQVSVAAAAQRQRLSQQQLLPGEPATLDAFSINGSVSYEVDFWGRYRRATEAARAQLLASEYAREQVQVGLVAGVVSAYFTLQALDEQLAITARTVRTRERFAALTQAQHQHGTVTGLEVASAQAQLAAAQATVPDLQRQVGQQEDLLSVLLGRNPDALNRGADEAGATPGAEDAAPVPPAGLPSALLERRPDVREAEQNLVAANAEVGVAKANLFPSISLTGALGEASTALSSLIGVPARTWSVGVGLVQPVIDAQRNLYLLELADAQKSQALLAYRQSVQRAFQEVADALIQRQKFAELEQVQRTQVDAERRAETIALARYKVVKSNYFDVITADTSLFNAELALANARLNARLAVVQLYQALGGGWQVEAAVAPVR
jgi:multidrug efflux system outer membrane protein